MNGANNASTEGISIETFNFKRPGQFDTVYRPNKVVFFPKRGGQAELTIHGAIVDLPEHSTRKAVMAIKNQTSLFLAALQRPYGIAERKPTH